MSHDYKKVKSTTVRVPDDVVEYVLGEMVPPETFGWTLRRLLGLMPVINKQENNEVNDESIKNNRKT